jgi:hypothetical protein
VNVTLPGVGCVVGTEEQPPLAGVDLKWVAVKLESEVAAQLVPMPTAPWEEPFVLHIEPS